MGRWTVRFVVTSALALPGALFAQAPTVWGVISRAALDLNIQDPDLRGRLSPGLPAVISGDRLNGPPKVTIGGRTAPVLQTEEGLDGPNYGFQMTVQIPTELAEGPAAVVITSGGVSSSEFQITLRTYSPFLVRIERARRAGTTPEISCEPGKTAAPGDIAFAYVVGLGPTNPPIPTGVEGPHLTVASTVTTPDITYGGTRSEVLGSILEPGEIGVYIVQFKMPPWAGWHDFQVSIGGVKSNILTLPVGNTIDLGGMRAPGGQSYAWACGGRLLDDDSASPMFGDPRNPPVNLAGFTVRFKGADNVERPAPLLSVASRSISYVVPDGTPPGYAWVTISTPNGTVFSGQLEIHNVAPFLSVWGAYVDDGPVSGAVNAIPLAVVVRLRNGVQTVEPVYDFNAGFMPLPIDFGPETDQLWLVLFGTGWRNRSSLAAVNVKIGGIDAPVEYAGSQGEYAGMDQVNVRLPRSLSGQGNALLVLAVDGQQANVAFLNFK